MNILHLTDLHFTYDLAEEQSKEKWNKIALDIVRGCGEEKIDVVAVTGDFTCHGAKEEFHRAEIFLQDVLDKLGLKREQVIMCPGNHDADTDNAFSSFEHYNDFCVTFYCGKQPLWHMEKEETKFAFVSMNTCYETSLELYEHATLQAQECKKLQQISDGEIGILLLHHPPETIMNQELFEEVMASGKISLILSGHQHMSQPRLYKAGDIVVVGGMAISPHRRWMAAGCQMIKINEKGNVEAEQILG